MKSPCFDMKALTSKRIDVRTSSNSTKLLTTLVLFLAVLGGFTALGHQMLWTRRMIDILGGTAESSSRVLGCFFLGLALGAAVAAFFTEKIHRPWRVLALLEGLIFVSVIPFLFLPGIVETLWQWIGGDVSRGWVGASVKTAASFSGVFPPAFLMGWFLPLAAEALFPTPLSFQRRSLWLYGINTLGGVVGLGLLSLWSLSALGVRGSFLALCVLHLLGIIGFLILDRWRSVRLSFFASSEMGASSKPSMEETADETVDGKPVPRTVSRPILLALSFFSGWAILSFEVLSLETMMLVAPLSFHAPAAILLGVILLLGLSALAAIPLRRWTALLPAMLLLAAVSTLLSSPVFFYLARAMGGLPPAETFALFWRKMVFLSLVAFGPAIFFAGFIFPFLTVLWGKLEEGERMGHRWGWMLAANGLGGFFGAEAGYRVVMPALGLHGGIGAIAMAYAGIAALLLLVGPWSTRRVAPLATGGAVAVFVLWGAAAILPQFPTINPYLGLRTLWEQHGADGSVAVVKGQNIGRGILVSNQYFLGTVSARYDQERQGHLPLLLHPDPRSVAFLGVATGMTPAAATIQTAPEEIVAFEISRTVLRASREFFSEENHALHLNPRVTLFREDARLGILSEENRYDVVIGDLFLPWGPGEARLYSREHFRAVHRSLRQDGLFAQWLPMFQLQEEHLASIVQTLQEVFPQVHVFMGGFQTANPMLALVAWKEENGATLDWEVVADRVRAEKENVADPVLRHVSGLRMLYLGSTDNLSLPQSRSNTLDNLHLELTASRDRIVKHTHSRYLNGRAWIEWLERNVHESSFAPSNALMRWQESNPHRSLANPAAQQLIPLEIRQDSAADWKRWPGMFGGGL